MSRVSRVLIIKLGAIGDVVMTIPAAYAMYQRGYAIDWICGRQVFPLLERYSWIHPIPIDDRALLESSPARKLRALLHVWKAVAARNYELCAILYYDRRYRLLSLPVRATRTLLLSHSHRTHRLLPGRHHTDEYLRVMLGGDLGPVPVGLAPVPPDSLPPSSLPPLSGRARVVLVPGGAQNLLRSDALRRWPVGSYVEVARALLERGCQVVLVGGPDDLWTNEAFRALPVTNMIGALTLLETVSLLDQSDVVVTHDTGPLHLAGITRVAIVSIFGPTDPRGRLPQRAATVALWGGEGFSCRPCYDGREYAHCSENTCIRQVTPEMVLVEVERLLQQRQSGALEPPRVSTPTSTVSAHLGNPQVAR